MRFKEKPDAFSLRDAPSGSMRYVVEFPDFGDRLELLGAPGTTLEEARAYARNRFLGERLSVRMHQSHKDKSAPKLSESEIKTLIDLEDRLKETERNNEPSYYAVFDVDAGEPEYDEAERLESLGLVEDTIFDYGRKAIKITPRGMSAVAELRSPKKKAKKKASKKSSKKKASKKKAAKKKTKRRAPLEDGECRLLKTPGNLIDMYGQHFKLTQAQEDLRKASRTGNAIKCKTVIKAYEQVKTRAKKAGKSPAQGLAYFVGSELAKCLRSTDSFAVSGKASDLPKLKIE